MKVFYIDLEQAESRVVGAIIYRLFGESAYLDACESGDLHTLVCSMCWFNLDWPSGFDLSIVQGGKKIPSDLLSSAKKVAGAIAYRDMSYRDLAKRLGHGTNYYGQPPTMAKHSHVDVRIIEKFQQMYFFAFPGIPRWHRWVAEQVQTTKQITTLLGRRRFFFGRPDNDATLREAIAYEPQSVATGDYMNLGLYNVWKENWPVHLFGQIHDAIAGAYDERDEHWLIPAICKKLETAFPIIAPSGESRMFSIPTEPLVGWNLAYRKEKAGEFDNDGNKIVINPDGLIKWKGKDDRERSRSLKRKITDFRLPHFRIGT